jgi:hypothetical protein
LLEKNFESALAAIPNGYREGIYEGWGTASPCGSLATEADQPVRASAPGRDVASVNLYRP